MSIVSPDAPRLPRGMHADGMSDPEPKERTVPKFRAIGYSGNLAHVDNSREIRRLVRIISFGGHAFRHWDHCNHDPNHEAQQVVVKRLRDPPPTIVNVASCFAFRPAIAGYAQSNSRFADNRLCHLTSFTQYTSTVCLKQPTTLPLGLLARQSSSAW